MNLIEIEDLKEQQFNLYQKIYQASKDLKKAIKLHEEAARTYQELKVSYEYNDRLIAEKELKLRDKEILNSKRKKKAKKSPQTKSWKKVLQAIEALPEEQQRAILVNINKIENRE